MLKLAQHWKGLLNEGIIVGVIPELLMNYAVLHDHGRQSGRIEQLASSLLEGGRHWAVDGTAH